MKKLIVFILLSIFAFNFAGFALLFFVEQHVIYYKMNEKVKLEANLERIALTKEQSDKYIWDDGKELKIEDRMYDIARQETKGDSIIYYAVYDDEEVHLFAKLESFFNSKNPKHSDGKMELNCIKFLSLVTLVPSSQDTGKTEILISSIKDIILDFNSIKLTPDTLPPRQC